MKARHLYIALCLLGLLGPNAAFLPWLKLNGIDVGLFIRDLFANGVSAFFALDVVVSFIVLCVFVLVEGGRLNLSRRWLPIAAACTVGVSFGLPLFLYQRQAHFDRKAHEIL
jgi:hypothetical protein